MTSDIEEEKASISFQVSFQEFSNFFKLDQGGVVKVEIYEVDTKIALYVDTF